MRCFTLTGFAAGLSLILGLGLPAPAGAEPLQPQHIPPDAKWVMHVDFDAFQKTALADRIRKNRPTMVEGFRKIMAAKYGIDQPAELHGLTMFNHSYQSHAGSAILFAEYDMAKVRAGLEKRPGMTKTTWNDHVLYTCPHATADDHAEENGGVTILLLDEHRMIFASSPAEVQAAATLVQGKTIAIDAKTSPLLSEVPSGAVFYGAAIDLGKIDQHEHAFPILRQHDRVVYSMGEDNGQVFENATFIAQSEETAKRMEQAFVGFVALYRVWSQGEAALTKLADKIEIRREDKTITSRFRAETDVAFAALQEVADRFLGEKHPANTAKREGAEVK